MVGLCVFYPRKNIQRDAVRIAQREELNVILEEFEDIEPDNVTLLIRHSSDNYIVFIDGDSEVDYETTDAYDKAHLSREVRLSTIYNRIEDLEHRPAVQYLSAKNQKALVRLLGNALAAELDMAQSEADKTIQMAFAQCLWRCRDLFGVMALARAKRFSVLWLSWGVFLHPL